MPNRDVILLLKFTLLEFKQFNKIYFALLFVHLVILFTEPIHFLIAVTKPTLLISLIAFYMQKGFKTLLYPQKLFLFGLCFSLLGDVLLIGEDYFIFGLGAFLIAQLAYTFAFYRSNYGQKGLIQKKPIVAAVVFTYTIAIIFFLKDSAGELMPAIVVYATVISLMLIAAINRKGVAQKESYMLVALGALSFVASDTLLAVNKFHDSFFLANIAVMLTYGIAQYLLVKGFSSILPKK